MDLEQKLEALRQEYKQHPSKILELRGKLLKWALEKRQVSDVAEKEIETIFLR